MDGEDDIPSLFGVNGMFIRDAAPPYQTKLDKRPADGKFTNYRSPAREATPSLEISRRLDNILSFDEDTNPISFDDCDGDFLKMDQLNTPRDEDDDTMSVASRTRSRVTILSEKAVTPSKTRVNAPFTSMLFNAAVNKSPSTVGGFAPSQSQFSFNSSRSTITGLSRSASQITSRAPSVFSQSPSTLTFRSVASSGSNLRSPFAKQYSNISNVSSHNLSSTSNLSTSFGQQSDTSMIKQKKKTKTNIYIVFTLVALGLLCLFLFSYYQVLQLQAQITAIQSNNPQDHNYPETFADDGEEDTKYFSYTPVLSAAPPATDSPPYQEDDFI